MLLYCLTGCWQFQSVRKSDEASSTWTGQTNKTRWGGTYSSFTLHYLLHYIPIENTLLKSSLALSPSDIVWFVSNTTHGYKTKELSKSIFNRYAMYGSHRFKGIASDHKSTASAVTHIGFEVKVPTSLGLLLTTVLDKVEFSCKKFIPTIEMIPQDPRVFIITFG